jgi:hypothetical protein
MRVGVVYRSTKCRGKDFAREKAEVYAGLVRHLDRRLGSPRRRASW